MSSTNQMVAAHSVLGLYLPSATIAELELTDEIKRIATLRRKGKQDGRGSYKFLSTFGDMYGGS